MTNDLMLPVSEYYYDEKGARNFLSAVSVSRILLKLKMREVMDVSKIGFGRCKATFKNGQVPKIFAHFVARVGIVYDVPSDM